MLTCSHGVGKTATARMFITALVRNAPAEVITDRALALHHGQGAAPAARHNSDRYETNRVECDHGRLKAWLRPRRGLTSIALPPW